jgi:hypothetical protein
VKALDEGITTMTVLAAGWVDASPFRAHLRFLTAVGSLTTEDVATLAGISGAAADHLLHGRSGRAVRRISPEVARRLISISANDVRSLRWRLVPAEKAQAPLARLRRVGCSDAEIAELAGASLVEVAALAGPSRHCSQLLVLRLTSAARFHDAPSARPRCSALRAAA